MARANVMNRTDRGSVPMSPSRNRRRMDSARPSNTTQRAAGHSDTRRKSINRTLTFSGGLDPVASLGNRRETQVRDPVAVRLGELAHEEAVLLAPDDLDRLRDRLPERVGRPLQHRAV